jgi:MFS family permease
MGIADIVFPLSKSLNGMILNGLLLGFSSGLAGPIMAYISDIAPVGHSLEAMSIYRTISDFGFAVGPIFLGWLIDVEGLHFPFYFSGALMLFAGVLMFCAREPLKK